MGTFLRNRSYHSKSKDAPYHLMLGNKPDLHRTKRFGSLAYVHNWLGPSLKKLDDNCGIGFLVGYLEDQAGYQTYFITEHAVQHCLNASINEDIVYKDRYADGYEENVSKWLTTANHAEDADGEEQEASHAAASLPSEAVEEDDDVKLPDFEELKEMEPAADSQEADELEEPTGHHCSRR
ncbi:hypothetical protein PR002_g15815 [Phytophthora rubi]|uniref:Retroviral polymerase SH3-like domain-containing protein n=1 Tax=Phytophthora rubi TaxID=129364 RepID=A0A6A3KYW4_9STRA|nr:hypothetical protein PR002_g15815 [Phytophthora rubi]